MKRSIDLVEDICAEMRPAKRLSMITNTPKQWKEQRRQILRLSKNKLKALGDVESNLRKSVLINNTYRKMRRELKEQCPYNTNVGFAPYCESGNNRVPNVRTNNGYTSMAKENLYQSSVCDHAPSVQVSTSSYKYSMLIEDNKSSLVSSNNEVVIGESAAEPMQSELVDTDSVSPPKHEATDPISNNTHTPEAASCAGLMDTNDPPITHTESPSEPIDFSLKAKDLTMASCSSGPQERSPLDGSAAYTDTEPCVDSTMDVEMTARPPQQGHTMGHTDSADPESNTTAIDHSTSSAASHDTEDFSLCKYANRPLHLPSLFSTDLIPFSTSSLVSILASREYASHYRPVCAGETQQSVASTDSVKTTDSTPQQTTPTPAPTPSPAHTDSTSDTVNLFSFEELESLEESMHTDSKSTDSLYEPFISCDSDTHLWQAAYQTFNMAVACS